MVQVIKKQRKSKTDSVTKSGLKQVQGDDCIEPLVDAVQKDKVGKATNEMNWAEVDGEVVGEYIQKLSISNQFIYNARNENVTLIVENLGYGDVYVSDNCNVRVGDEAQRILFKEQRAIKGSKLFFTSASQPIVSIVEISRGRVT